MATPRRRYRVDALTRADGTIHVLLRTPAILARATVDLAAVGWCPHHVRGTSRQGALDKAKAQHQTRCSTEGHDAPVSP